MDSLNMNVFEILDNVIEYSKSTFKIGFVGNGEPLLSWDELKSYIEYLSPYPQIKSYTITNGTVLLPNREWEFLEAHKVNIGFSIDGYKELHDKYRSNSFDCVMKTLNAYKDVVGHYPTFNATVGRESLKNYQRVIDFFEPFKSRVTFSRMIGKYGISLPEYRFFLEQAEKTINVRRGKVDCTMYGGHCGAGINNFFFANGNVYLCGNCIDLPSVGDSKTDFRELERIGLEFDRNYCYKELL